MYAIGWLEAVAGVPKDRIDRCRMTMALPALQPWRLHRRYAEAG